MGRQKLRSNPITLLHSPQMLIATNQLNKSAFEKQVILLHEYNEFGSKGLIINQPLETALGAILEQLNIKSTKEDINKKEIYLGGPVERSQGVIVSFEKKHKQHSLSIASQNQNLLEAINDRRPDEFLVALGHTAWAPGQLEKELSKGYWVTRGVDPALIFDTPVQDRWLEASQSIGFDIRNMANFVGHG